MIDSIIIYVNIHVYIVCAEFVMNLMKGLRDLELLKNFLLKQLFLFCCGV